MLGFGIVSRLVSGVDLRPHRRPAHAAARLGAAGRRAAALPAVRRAGVAVRDLGAVRPVPGRHRAVVRDHRARALSRRTRPARASAPSSWPRCSAWRSAAGCRARSSTSPARTTPRSSTASRWNLLNLSIAVFLLRRAQRLRRPARCPTWRPRAERRSDVADFVTTRGAAWLHHPAPAPISSAGSWHRPIAPKFTSTAPVCCSPPSASSSLPPSSAPARPRAQCSAWPASPPTPA